MAGHIRGTDVELRAIASKEGGVATAFFLGEHIDLTFELGVGGDGAWLHQHHAPFDVFLLDAAKKQTSVVASHALFKLLPEHFHTGNGGGAGVADTNDFDGFTHLHLAALNPASGNGATASD